MSIDRKIFSLNQKKPIRRRIGKAKLLQNETQVLESDPRAQTAFEMAGHVYDYMFTNFTRDGFDGIGKPILIYVHAFKNSGIAKFYHSAQSDHVVFGDGDSKSFNSPLESLDIVAHELMHGYFTYLCPVHYGFSDGGAILEHLCDIFGIMIRRQKAGSSNDWIMGVNYSKQSAGIRDLKNPSNPDVHLPCKSHYINRIKYRSHNNLYENAGILSAAYVAAEEDYQKNNSKSILPIWYAALQSIPRNCDFPTFAKTIVTAASQSDPAAIPSINSGLKMVGL